MAFKRCGKVRYVDPVSKENEEDSELTHKVYHGREARQNYATVECAIDVAAVPAEKISNGVPRQQAIHAHEDTVEKPCKCCSVIECSSKMTRNCALAELGLAGAVEQPWRDVLRRGVRVMCRGKP
jgi:hypothetical protein